MDLYNARAAEQGVSENMKAVRAELKGDGSELDGAKFDVIVVRSFDVAVFTPSEGTLTVVLGCLPSLPRRTGDNSHLGVVPEARRFTDRPRLRQVPRGVEGHGCACSRCAKRPRVRREQDARALRRIWAGGRFIQGLPPRKAPRARRGDLHRSWSEACVCRPVGDLRDTELDVQ